MKNVAIVFLSLSILLVQACASYNKTQDEGGIVGSGTKPDCSKKTNRPECTDSRK